jgi:hypothetical protein
MSRRAGAPRPGMGWGWFPRALSSRWHHRARLAHRLPGRRARDVTGPDRDGSPTSCTRHRSEHGRGTAQYHGLRASFDRRRFRCDAESGASQVSRPACGSNRSHGLAAHVAHELVRHGAPTRLAHAVSWHRVALDSRGVQRCAERHSRRRRLRAAGDQQRAQRHQGRGPQLTARSATSLWTGHREEPRVRLSSRPGSERHSPSSCSPAPREHTARRRDINDFSACPAEPAAGLIGTYGASGIVDHPKQNPHRSVRDDLTGLTS